MKWLLRSCVILLAVINPTFATDEIQMQAKNDELITVADCVNFTKKVGSLVQNGMVEDAFNLLHDEKYFARTDLTITQKRAALANFQAVNEAIDHVVKSTIYGGFDFIKVTKSGECVISVYFWSKHQYAPVPWRLNFYKPRNTWKILDFAVGPEAVPEIFLNAQLVDFQEHSKIKTNN